MEVTIKEVARQRLPLFIGLSRQFFIIFIDICAISDK